MKSINVLRFFLKCVFLAFFPICFLSCENECYLQQLYVVDNKTDKEFMLCFEYKIFTNEIEVLKNSILAKHELEHVLYNKISLRVKDDIGTGDFTLWVYDRKDSVFVKINRDEIDRCFCDYGSVKVEETGKNTPLIKNEYKVIVTESLISKMTKNTHLTDSVFGLK